MINIFFITLMLKIKNIFMSSSSGYMTRVLHVLMKWIQKQDIFYLLLHPYEVDT